MGDTSERITACIAVENAIAEVYNNFSNRFSEARDFFFELSREEVNHATILEVASGYQMTGKLPESMTPVSLPRIYATLDLIESVKKKIKDADIPLMEALEISLAMESSKVESYLLETLTEKTDDKVISNLRKLLVDEKSHIEKLEGLRKQLELKNPL